LPNQPQAAPNALGSQPLGSAPGGSTVTSVSPNAPGANGGVASQSSGPAFNPQAIQVAPSATPGPQSQPSEVASLPSPAAPPPPEAPIAAPPTTASGNAFTWPVQGSVISGYGPKEGGLYNEGINIAVPQGTPVRAAQDGEVAYVGNELRGYGNLLLVRHPNGWVTAYAHNQQLLVQRGDKVKRGQVIARSGATGNVDAPQVHFELRQGTRSVDPTRYLGGQGVTDRGGVGLANGG
jgi:murein DD-endopeptidase MepM/ murein hydrolase activator NlpD